MGRSGLSASRVLRLLGIAVIALAPLGVSAKVLDCRFKPGRDTEGWIAERTIITWDEAAATASVNDSLIDYYNKTPIEAKVTRPSAKQVAFSWSLNAKDVAGQYARQLYRATFFPANNTMVIISKPSGFRETYDARGLCTLS